MTLKTDKRNRKSRERSAQHSLCVYADVSFSYATDLKCSANILTIIIVWKHYVGLILGHFCGLTRRVVE